MACPRPVFCKNPTRTLFTQQGGCKVAFLPQQPDFFGAVAVQGTATAPKKSGEERSDEQSARRMMSDISKTRINMLYYDLRRDPLPIMGETQFLESTEGKTIPIMSQQQRLIQLPLISAVIFCLLVGVYLLASKRFSKRNRSIPITKHSVETPSGDTLKYWTADKKRHAKPADLPNVTALGREKPHPRGPSN